MQACARFINQYKLTALESTSTNYLKHGIKILDLLTNIENVYLNASVEEKQNLIKNVLQNLTLEGGNVGYYYKTPFNIFVKGVVYNNWWTVRDDFRTYLLQVKEDCIA